MKGCIEVPQERENQGMGENNLEKDYVELTIVLLNNDKNVIQELVGDEKRVLGGAHMHDGIKNYIVSNNSLREG